MKNVSLKKSKKIIIYVKKDLVLMMTIKNIIKLEIALIILENVEKLLMKFVISDIKHQNKFL